MKKTLIIGGLLLSSFMNINAEAAQPVKAVISVSKPEHSFYFSFLADMRNPDNDRIHRDDDHFDRSRYERRRENDWHEPYRYSQDQSRFIVDRMSERLFLTRKQKRQIYMILTDQHEPAGRYKRYGRWDRSEYVRYMKWKRRETDRRIVNVLNRKQKEIYLRMKTEGAEFAVRIGR